MKIVLYKTTTCPKCKILKTKLDSIGIEYEECLDKDKMIELGIMKVPVLEVDGTRMEYIESNTWIDNKAKEIRNNG